MPCNQTLEKGANKIGAQPRVVYKVPRGAFITPKLIKQPAGPIISEMMRVFDKFSKLREIVCLFKR
jgi:hypothetical protein